MYDLIIVGGGPGGVAAGVYAARKKIRTLLVTDSFGGQSLTSADVQNWIGTKSASGYELGKMLEEHLRAQEGIEIADGDLVTEVRAEKNNRGFSVRTKSGASYETKYILIASGSRRRKLGIPGEKELDGKGVVYCSTCDAPLFKGKKVAVVGGGNAGLEAAIDLFPYALKIHLLEYSDTLKGDPVTEEKVRGNPNVEIITMAESSKVLGSGFVSGLEYKDRKSGETKTLAVGGVFVEIGAIPNTEFVSGLVATDRSGEIVVDHRTQRTSQPGIWAVGDATDVLYKQNNVSAGDAIKAVLNIDEVLHKRGASQ